MVTGQIGRRDRKYKASPFIPKRAPFRKPEAFLLLKALYFISENVLMKQM